MFNKGDIMENLKRYDFTFYQTNCDCHYVDNPNGEWVKFEDVKELLNTDTQQLKVEISEILNRIISNMVLRWHNYNVMRAVNQQILMEVRVLR